MTSTSGVYTAPYFISTLPLGRLGVYLMCRTFLNLLPRTPGVLQHHPPKFSPRLPARHRASLSRVGFGLLNKVVLVYPSVWWDPTVIWWSLLPSSSKPTTDNPSPEEVLDRHTLSVQNYSTLQDGAPVIVVFIGGSTAVMLERMSDAKVHDYFEKRIGRGIPLSDTHTTIASPPSCVSCFATRWLSEPYSRGSYAYLPPAAENQEGASPLDMIELGRSLWDGRLGWAGEHTVENQ